MSGKNLLTSCINIMENSPIYKDKLLPYLENSNREYKKTKVKIFVGYSIIVVLLLIIIYLLYKISKK